MALNKFMHPRNPYKVKKPNFKELSEKYEEFREQVTIDEKGHYHIDFKKPECLKVLSWALLKEDFDLDVLMPLDRLIPTIPLRLNYILWLEDILGESAADIRGIDIGTGASCVYPLLGAKKNSWNFLATEIDPTNYSYAKRNVEKNNLADKIKVLEVAESCSLFDVLGSSDEQFDFCMCNPPFYGSNFEAWGLLTSRTDKRPEPTSVSTASPSECIAPGGEVEFTKRLVADSLQLKSRIRIYTTMLGKKSSLPVVKEELRKNGVTNVSQTEFCQGKTMRWGLGWTFDDTVTFPKPPSKVIKADKPRPPVVYHILQHDGKFKGGEYSQNGVVQWIKQLLIDLEIAVMEKKSSDKKVCIFDLEAKHNTWSNQRKKRRQQRDSGNVSADLNISASDSNEKNSPENTNGVKRNIDSGDVESVASKQMKLDVESLVMHQSDELSKNISHTSSDNHNSIDNYGKNLTPLSDASTTKISEQCPKTSDSESPSKQHSDPSHVLFKGKLKVNAKKSNDIFLELEYLSGQNRESIHQVLQYIKNKLQ